MHGVARRSPRGVTVYLIPGLTVGERRAVLRRLRQEASRGFGPPLPRFELALALCADRVRTATGTAAAVIRLHPAVTLLPGAFVAAMMTLFVCAAASGSVDFTPGNGPARMGGGLALSPDGGAGQSGGRAQALPVDDRQLFTVDDLGTADVGGQPLGLGNPAAGKHAHGHGTKAKAKGNGKTETGNGSSGNGKGNQGKGSEGDGRGSGGAGGDSR